MSHGYCCHWMWADWWDGTYRYDVSQSAPTATPGDDAEAQHSDGIAPGE